MTFQVSFTPALNTRTLLGCSLKEYVFDGEAMGMGQPVDLVLSVLGQLLHAHQCHMQCRALHRDIKADNIMLRDDNTATQATQSLQGKCSTSR
jgi:serine/threonine protein kinase